MLHLYRTIIVVFGEIMFTKNNEIKDYDFFISFCKSDIVLVSSIVEVMENQYGAKCWFQEKDSRAEFVDAIMQGIESASAFIVFVSPASANSYFVLNEVNHAIEWKSSHDDYKIVPVLIGPENVEINDPAYKRIHFYLGRINTCIYKRHDPLEELVRNIFNQAEYEPVGEKLHKSLYHSSVTETKRIFAQNEILCDFSHEYFLRYVKPEMYILDVGCADGANIIMRLSGIEYRGVLGIDIEKEQIHKAQIKFGNSKNTFACADVFSNEFDDTINDYLEDHELIGFDIIHVSAIILHLAEPIKMLQILKRFLKKSGYIFIQDEDDGANIVHPYSKFFDNAFAIWGDSKESGDRYCARKIYSYLLSAGYKRLISYKCGVSNIGLNSEKREALWDIYFNYHLWLALEENMFYNPLKTNKLLEEYKKDYDVRKQEYDNGEIFIQLGFMFFVAQR